MLSARELVLPLTLDVASSVLNDDHLVSRAAAIYRMSLCHDIKYDIQ